MRAVFIVVAGLGLALAGCAQASAPAGSSSSPSPCSARQDRPQPGTPGATALTGIQFTSPARGWAVGDSQILATTDGGSHWTVQDSGKLDLASVDFVDGRHGWAVGDRLLLRTTDGGAHWTALPEPCPMIRQVNFVSPLDGFAIAGGVHLLGENMPTAPLLGGVVLGSTDGGRTWHRLPAPAAAQSVCFDNASTGWLGAGGALYRTTDGGQTWARTAARIRPPSPGYSAFMLVQCAGAGSAWALAIGPGAAMSQEPHVAFHAGPAGTRPVFAEQYFPHPGIRVRASSPGSYAGAVAVISPQAAAFVDWCVACGYYGTVPWALVTDGGATIIGKPDVAGLNQPAAASFLSPQLGWVAGALVRSGPSGTTRSYPRIVATTDGGRTWHVVYMGSP